MKKYFSRLLSNKSGCFIIGIISLLLFLGIFIIIPLFIFGFLIFNITLAPYFAFDYKEAKKIINTIPPYPNALNIKESKAAWPDESPSFRISFVTKDELDHVLSFYNTTGRETINKMGFLGGKILESYQAKSLSFYKDKKHLSISLRIHDCSFAPDCPNQETKEYKTTVTIAITEWDDVNQLKQISEDIQ